LNTQNLGEYQHISNLSLQILIQNIFTDIITNEVISHFLMQDRILR